MKKIILSNTLFSVYIFLLGLYCIFSYALTAPNLILTSWRPYWRFQQYMWQTFFNDRPLLTFLYTGLIISLFLVYYILLKTEKLSFLTKNKTLIIAGIILLILANNALSYDVFNYIFNAKMVVVYKANPHIQVALDFARDPWTRFMHNTHTPAPYGYGWTVFSLIPFALGMGKFLPTWLIFRLLSVLSLVLLWRFYNYSANKLNFQKALIFLNPLVLVEIITNSHNDLWMMLPAMMSLVILVSDKKLNKKKTFLSALLLVVSISTKLATATLIPLWVLLFAVKSKNLLKIFKQLTSWKKLINNHWPLLASVLMFLPLFTSRSQQFLPWYLVWSLVWIPLMRVNQIIKPNKQSNTTLTEKINYILNILTPHWKNLLLIFSFTAMLRYIPFLYAGEFSPEILLQQKLVLWSAVGIWILSTLLIPKNNLRLKKS